MKVKCNECEEIFDSDDDLSHMNNCPKEIWVKALILLYDRNIFEVVEE